MPACSIVPNQSRLKVFGRHARLRTQAHLAWVKRRGRSRAGSLAVMAVVVPPPDGARRVAFVISRRYSPLAVVRNRARRLFREAYRLLVADWSPAWVVLIPRARMRTARMEDVREDLYRHGVALGVLAEIGRAHV